MPIHVQINSTNGERLKLVEKTVKNSGMWSEENNGTTHTLDTGFSGSGLLRFRTASAGFFSVIVGIGSTGTPWADVQVDLAQTDTGLSLHPEYFGKGRLSHEYTHTEVTRTTSSRMKIGISLGDMYSGQLTATLDYSYGG